MITITKLNHQAMVINAELIKFIERTPDTMITLTTGEKLLVRESLDEVVERAIQYGRRVRCFPVDMPGPATPADG
jgi:flagellar protein FlbD